MKKYSHFKVFEKENKILDKINDVSLGDIEKSKQYTVLENNKQYTVSIIKFKTPDVWKEIWSVLDSKNPVFLIAHRESGPAILDYLNTGKLIGGGAYYLNDKRISKKTFLEIKNKH